MPHIVAVHQRDVRQGLKVEEMKMRSSLVLIMVVDPTREVWLCVRRQQVRPSVGSGEQGEVALLVKILRRSGLLTSGLLAAIRGNKRTLIEALGPYRLEEVEPSDAASSLNSSA